MKRFFYIMTICLICGTMMIPEISASERGTRNGSEQRDRGGRQGSQPNRPSRGNNGNRDNRHQDNGGDKGSSYRPGNNNDRNNAGGGRPDNGAYRPGNGNNGGNNGGYRPGNNGGRPDNGGYRPGNGNHGGNNGGYRPGNGHNHGGNGGYRPDHGGYRPSPGYGGNHYGHINRPPQRPYRPAPCPYHRPAPPVHYRPHCHISPLQAILGVALGVAFDNSVNIFLGRNYYVDGYADNYLYMRNLNAYNYTWPDVMLYYNNGYLASSQFSYSTSNYDGYRYNNLYNQLYNMYGAPAVAQSIANGRRVTWWGYDNQYITLEFQSVYNYGSGIRYYTNLIIGQ